MSEDTRIKGSRSEAGTETLKYIDIQDSCGSLGYDYGEDKHWAVSNQLSAYARSAYADSSWTWFQQKDFYSINGFLSGLNLKLLFNNRPK